MSYYPIVLEPQALNSRAALPPLPAKPICPIPPAKSANLPDVSPPLPFSFFLVGSAIFALGILFVSHNQSFGWLILAVGSLLSISSLWSRIEYWSNSNNRDRLERENESLYERRTNFYNEVELPKFEQRTVEHSAEVEVLTEIVYVFWYRVEHLKKGLLNVAAPVKSPNEYKIGKAEAAFAIKLTEHFGSLLLSGFSPFETKGGFLPDFVIYDPVMGYCIDIEIDEPYDLTFGDPIHYKGADSFRNEHFLKKNWIVIRFAEQQVVQQPEGCCDFIAKTINEITLGLARLPTDERIASLIPVLHWSKENAIEMEIENFRESYLLKEEDHLAGDFLFQPDEFRKARRDARVQDQSIGGNDKRKKGEQKTPTKPNNLNYEDLPF